MKYALPESAKPCPFCGTKNQTANVDLSWDGGKALISCKCGLRLELRKEVQEYVPVENDLYRLVGETDSEFLHRIGKTWNKRWHE